MTEKCLIGLEPLPRVSNKIIIFIVVKYLSCVELYWYKNWLLVAAQSEDVLWYFQDCLVFSALLRLILTKSLQNKLTRVGGQNTSA